MRSHSLIAILLLLLLTVSAKADVVPRPRYVRDASDVQVYAQNLIVIGLLLAGVPIIVGLTVARWTPRWAYRVPAVLLGCFAGIVLCCVGYLSGLIITNDYWKYQNGPRPRPPTQPAAPTTDLVEP